MTERNHSESWCSCCGREENVVLALTTGASSKGLASDDSLCSAEPRRTDRRQGDQDDRPC
jgi:hypothetical protein